MFLYSTACLHFSVKHTKFIVRKFRTTAYINSSFTLAHSPNAKLNKNIIDRYLCLPIPECFSIVKYVWIDGTGENVRSKSRTLEYIPDSHKECPNWAYEGQNTNQATGQISEASIIPVALYNDPFRRGNNKLVLCDTYTYEGRITKTNHRAGCFEAMCKVKDCEPMFGIEQDYQLMDADGRPFGWPVMNGHPEHTNEHYCGVGANKVYAREIAECHYRACLYAGIQLDGINADPNLGQWEFRIGVCKGIKGPDDLWMARFILERIAEEFGVTISLNPVVCCPLWHSNSMHVNFSTKPMREDDGIKQIEEACVKLSKKHKEHLAVYDPLGGEHNKKRLNGSKGTSLFDKFTWGVADRSFSVRIPKAVSEKKKGYFEDRRPASNCDPYQACNMLVRTCIMGE